MKKVSILLLVAFCLLGISYGQSKMTPALTKATQDRRPDEKTNILIVMTQQYDASGLEQRTPSMSRKNRSRLVTEELQQLSQETQADLIGLLKANPDKVSDITPFWIINGIGCKATPDMIRTIAQREDVSIIELDDAFQTPVVKFEEAENDNPRELWNITQIHADQVWTYNGTTGYTGNGVVVAVLDCGVNYLHNDLKPHMWNNGTVANPVYGYNAIFPDEPPLDDNVYGNGQGSMVAGIIAGSTTGIARDAQIMAVKISNSEGVTTQTMILNGVQFADGTTNPADIIVITACENGIEARASYRQMMDNLQHSKVVVTSAGDQGQTYAVPYSISSPSNCPSPWHNPDETANGGRSANICVGATDKNDMKVFSSSIGPVTWSGIGNYNDYPYTPGSAPGLIRPDVVAPGTSIMSTNYSFGATNSGYTTASGTALSAAHVAGVIALMLEANPQLTPANIDRILETTATKCEGDVKKNNYYGAGRIDAYEAINSIKATTINPPTNLAAEANVDTVTLSWTAATNAISYDIFCNEECIAQGVTGTTYTYQTDFSGHHFYYLKSNRNNGNKSAKSTYAYVFVDPVGPLATILTGEVNDHNVTISWEAPVPPTVMRYGSAETNTNSEGMDNEQTFWAQRFLPATLTDYAGCVIDSISIYFIKNGNYDVYIYNGNPNGVQQELFHATVTPTTIKSWTKIPVEPGIAIDHTKDLWIMAKAPKSISNPGALCRIYNSPNSFASLKSSDKKSWTPVGNTYAWMMKAHLSTSEYTYNVLNNGVEVAHGLSTLSFTENDVPSGVHYYTITTNYSNGTYTSFPSQPKRVNVDTRFIVTLDPGNGTCSQSSLQQTAQDGPVVLPTATPSSSCQAEGYTFAGWSTEIINSEAEQPDLLLAGSQYVPQDDITLYAVYKNIQGQHGWKLARTIQDGDSIRIICQAYNVELSNISEDSFQGGSSTFNVNTPAHTFTARETEGGYALIDSNGNYLCKREVSYLCMSNTLYDNCIWSIEIINGIAVIRNSQFNSDDQLMATKEGSTTIFSCIPYTTTLGSQVRNIQLYRYTASSFCSYDHSPECGMILQAPTLDPYADGIYLDPLQVLMSSTSGATIRYTLDGSEPNQNSNLYIANQAPVINTTTTIKARAFKSGYSNSAVTTQTYTYADEYTTISAFKSAANSTGIAKITSNMRVTHQYPRHLYVNDNSGGLLIYDDYNLLSETFVDGDSIGNVFGRYQKVNGQVMLVLMHDIEKHGTSGPVTPLTKTIGVVNNSYNTYDAQLMLFKGVHFVRNLDVFDSDTTSIVQNGKKLVVRNQFGNVNCPVDKNSTYDVIGLMGIDGTLKMVYPRSNNDIRKYYSVTCEASGNGTLTANSNSISAFSTVSLTATPSNGYHLESLYYYGSNPNETIDIDLNEQSFVMPEEDVTVVAVFAIDVYYTVTFNQGSGNCSTTSLTETSWGSGVILPNASPSANCVAEGYTFQGWADHLVTETMARPRLFLPDSTYYPNENITLFAVYAIGGDEWNNVTSVNDLIEGNYIIYTKYNNNYYFMLQEGATSNVKAKRMIFKNGLPTAPALTNYNPLDHLWTIKYEEDVNQYSISYTDSNNTTYYLKAFRDANQGISVTTNNPVNGWEFSDNNIAGSKQGLLACFPNLVSDKVVRYLDIDQNASRWLYHAQSGYKGELYLFMSPSNIYSSFPECQMAVATPEFVNLPEGDVITENDYLVTLTCSTPGATIYYTTNDEEPDNTSTPYTGPFTIDDECTVKAIAYNSAGDYSYVASYHFTFITRYATIAAFKNNPPATNEVVRITGDVTSVYHHGEYLYLYDETAGLLVKDPNSYITHNYSNGDVIQGGILGKYLKTNKQPMMILSADPAEGIAGTPVEPIVVNINTLSNDNNYSQYDARLVTLTDASFTTDYDLSALNASYSVTQVQGGNSLNVINQFGTLNMTGNANEHFDITGLVGTDNTTKRLYPRSDNDFDPYYNIYCDNGIPNGDISTNPLDRARANETVNLIASPQTGFVVEQWTVTAQGNNIPVNGSTFTMPASDVYVTASFTLQQFNVTVEASPTEGGSVSIDEEGPYFYGDIVTVHANFNEGYTFKHWLKNGVIDKYNAHTTFEVNSDLVLTAVFEVSENYYIAVSADPETGGSVSGNGNYSPGSPVSVTATANPGWEFINWTENDVEVSNTATYNFNATGNRNLVAHFVLNGAIQNVEFAAGWAWFSSFIEGTDELFAQIQNSIAATSTSAQIKSLNDGFVSLSNGNWSGTLQSIDNEQMYLIKSEGCSMELNGAPANPANHPITLNPGWNWIGFVSQNDMTPTAALANLQPNIGDMIKNQGNFATYTANGWRGGLLYMEPGSGFLYLNKGGTMTLTYPGASKEAVDKTPQPRHWTTNHSAFPTNLSMMVTLDENVFAMSEDSHEIGAFVNGECRGSARLQYVDGHYLAFLPVSGNEGDEVTFQLYDVNTDTMFGTATEYISYTADAVIGTVTNPMTLHFRNTGVEAFQTSANVYPNPANNQLTVTCDGMEQVNIVSLVGQTLLHENTQSNEIQLSVGNLAPGLYLLQITRVDGSVLTTKIEIQK